MIASRSIRDAGMHVGKCGIAVTLVAFGAFSDRIRAVITIHNQPDSLGVQ